MARPDPKRGQVVRYEYLWATDSLQGEAKGDKRRPCAVVVTIAAKKDQPLQAMLCGITHTEPRPPSEGVLIPLEVKESLGLDDERSWVIVSEVNKVKWADNRFALTDAGHWTYGSLPIEVMEEIREKIMAHVKRQTFDTVNRPEIDQRTAAGE